MEHIRVIARLDVKGPNVVKGVQFEALRVLGKPGDLAKKYFAQGADELLYLDTVASLYRRENLLHIVREASKSIFIPFTAGGGVRTIQDIHDLLQAGAEKVAINTAATKRPQLIKEAAERFGSQCIVLSIEAKQNGPNSWEVYTDNGRESTGLDVVEWAQRGESLGAGEILLTSVDTEGTARGLDAALIQAVSAVVSIPVIASGGASSPKEIADSLFRCKADAVAVGSILHYDKTTIADIKDAIAAKGFSVRTPTEAQRALERKPAKEAGLNDYNQFTLRQLGDNVDIYPGASLDEERFPFVDAKNADVVIIDYGINNVKSVAMAIGSLGKKVAIALSPEAILDAKRLILPGVGAFGDGMSALREKKYIEAIRTKIQDGVPFFGICLGMQLLFSESEEFGFHEGLDIIKGKVVSFPSPESSAHPGYKLPHIGWGEIHPPKKTRARWKNTALHDTKPGQLVYFVHSFYPVPENGSRVLAISSYGGIDFCAAVNHKNITATQFHPEKSGEIGLRMLQKFCEQKCA